MDTKNSLNSEVAGFTGTAEYHKFSILFYNYHMTDGVKYCVDEHGLYWFLDVICSYQDSKMRAEEFQVWTLKRSNENAFSVVADDGNGNILQTQEIEFSDFTKDHFQVYLIDKIILLPSEY